MENFTIRTTEDFSRLYDLHASKFYFMIARTGLERKASEYILTESFINIWNNRNQYNPAEESQSRWMARIVKLTISDYLSGNLMQPSYKLAV